MPNPYLDTAIEAAKQAGAFLREHFENTDSLQVNESTQHDIKLELDLRSQSLITDVLLGAHPEHALYGEEGIAGNQDSPWQWIVDPIDGTVNYFYGIPHFCVSIALRQEGTLQLGVIYDPMTDELWTAARGEGASRNGQPIQASRRVDPKECVMTVGFSKTVAAMEDGLARFQSISRSVRKIRMMGSAALGLAYVANGRLDAYLEGSLGLWDIAAGVVLVEEAGGKVSWVPREDDPDKFGVAASNGLISIPGVL